MRDLILCQLVVPVQGSGKEDMLVLYDDDAVERQQIISKIAKIVRLDSGSRAPCDTHDRTLTQSSSTRASQRENHNQKTPYARTLRQQHTAFLTGNLAFAFESGTALTAPLRSCSHPCIRALCAVREWAQG